MESPKPKDKKSGKKFYKKNARLTQPDGLNARIQELKQLINIISNEKKSAFSKKLLITYKNTPCSTVAAVGWGSKKNKLKPLADR